MPHNKDKKGCFGLATRWGKRLKKGEYNEKKQKKGSIR